MNLRKRDFGGRKDNGLPAGPTALGHPTNEDLFVGTPVRAATS